MQFPAQHPTVMGTIMTAGGLRLLSEVDSPAHAAEVRVDALLAAQTSLNEMEAALKKRRLPVLLTVRIPAEGGQIALENEMRCAIFLQLLPFVEAIDVELASAEALRPALDAARVADKTIIFSAHSIEQPATALQVTGWINQYQPAPDTVLKIASRIDSWRNLQQLAALLIDHPDWPIAVMGLGPHAPQSRAVLTALGSRLVYGYLDQPAAPGQPSAADARKMAEAVTIAR